MKDKIIRYVCLALLLTPYIILMGHGLWEAHQYNSGVWSSSDAYDGEQEAQ